MRKKILVISFTLILLCLLPYQVSAPDWRERARFTGSGTEILKDTDNFHVPEKNWRIKWSYVPHADFPSFTVFGFFVYQKGETEVYENMVLQMGSENTEGIMNLYANLILVAMFFIPSLLVTYSKVFQRNFTFYAGILQLWN